MGGAGVWCSPWWPGGCLLLNHPCGLQPGGWIAASDESLTALQTSSWKVLLLSRNYSAFPCWQCWALIRPCPQALEAGLWGKTLAVDPEAALPVAGLRLQTPPLLIASEDSCLLKALGKSFSASISFPGSVAKCMWLYLIFKNITDDGLETEDSISCEAYFQWAEGEMSSLPVGKASLLPSMIYISKQPLGRKLTNKLSKSLPTWLNIHHNSCFHLAKPDGQGWNWLC